MVVVVVVVLAAAEEDDDDFAAVKDVLNGGKEAAEAVKDVFNGGKEAEVVKGGVVVSFGCFDFFFLDIFSFKPNSTFVN